MRTYTNAAGQTVPLDSMAGLTMDVVMVDGLERIRVRPLGFRKGTSMFASTVVIDEKWWVAEFDHSRGGDYHKVELDVCQPNV